MKKCRLLLIAVAACYSSYSFSMFCPTNFNTISLGDSMENVQAQCGKPDSQKSSKSEINQPQEWTYYAVIPADPYRTGVPNNQGTMKVTFSFVDNKTVNITSNGLGVGATTICNNKNLQLGSTIQDVKNACGKAPIVTKTNVEGEGTPPPISIDEWTYLGNNPQVLIFEGGKLKARKNE